ncbi:hypothetical protein SAMN05444680_12411 [Variovorax sp. YR216]|nr:hypothetical protein [Variovorax sp. YR216]SEB25191.1 hypothetical protein SAMN05444680_12411 [Variovorax sp. YR216]
MSQRVSYGSCGYWLRTSRVAAAVSLLFVTGTAFATDQAQQRQQGRAVNQAAKHEARSAKIDCRAENQQSNAQCRQDKRQTKQDGRQAKREIKY